MIKFPDTVLPILTEITTETDNYWVPIPKTAIERKLSTSNLIAIFRKMLSKSKLQGELRPSHDFESSSTTVTYTTPISLTTDTYSYRKSEDDALSIGLLKELNLLDSDKHRHTRSCTSFMFEGIEFKIFHLSAPSSVDKIYLDTNTVPFFTGYGGQMLPLLNILFKPFNFELDDLTCLYYVLQYKDTVQKYKICANVESVCKLLDLNSGRYSRVGVYYSFKGVNSLVTFLLESKYIGRSSFYLNSANEYIGPDDYFGCSLFKDLVFAIQRDFSVAKHTSDNLPETIVRNQLRYWKDNMTTGYDTMVNARNKLVKEEIVSSKYNLDIVSEITGYELNDTRLPIFKKLFETRISETEDLDFFLLSSSEDTIRERLTQYNLQLGP
jgi:hypothetical protein